MTLPVSPVSSGMKENIIILPGLSMGTLVQLQFEGLGSSRSVLLGMDPGKFLIVQTPPISDIWSKNFMKNHGVVRYLSAGRVYAFRTTLMGIIKEPCRFSILSYPESLEVVNLRRFERISCIIDAEIRVTENIHEGIVTDISMGGCSFDFNQSEVSDFPEIQIPQEVSITLNLKDKGTLREIPAVVRSARRDRNNLSLGLQFARWEETEQDGKTNGALAEYLRSLVEGL